MGKFTADVVLCLSSRRIDLTSSSSKALQHPILIMRIKNDLLTEFAWNKSPKTIPWQSRLTPHVTTPYQTEMLEWNTRGIDKEDHNLKGHVPLQCTIKVSIQSYNDRWHLLQKLKTNQTHTLSPDNTLKLQLQESWSWFKDCEISAMVENCSRRDRIPWIPINSYSCCSNYIAQSWFHTCPVVLILGILAARSLESFATICNPPQIHTVLVGIP